MAVFSFGQLTPKKKKIGLVLLGCLGLLLILVGSLGKNGAGKEETGQVFSEDSSTLAYIERVENRIRTITEQITGSDDPSVLVTVKGGPEYVYVSNEKADGAKEYVTVRKENGAGELILIREIYPEIEGVSVVCRGGDSPEIKAKLISVISTALGVSSNRICIVGEK